MALAVVMAISTVQSASALSIFAHNRNIPLLGADITYTVRDKTIQYMYVFHRHLNWDSRTVELPLPDRFQEGDLLTVTLLNPNDSYFQRSEAAELGNGGMDIWFIVAP